MAIFDDLRGTINNLFRVGFTGVNLKSTAGSLAIRNTADSADAPIVASKLSNTGNTLDIGTTNVLTVSRNAAQSGSLTVIYPSAKATDGQVLAQKAGTTAGVIEFEFVSVGGSADKYTGDTTSLAFGSASPVTMFNLPANAVISHIVIYVDTVFNGTPSLSIGIAGTPSKYVPSNMIDLSTLGLTRYYPELPPSASAEALIATYAANGATAGAARIIVSYVVPS